MNNTKIAIIGLGYVGLPLAVEFAKKFQVVGFDINQDRIDELRRGTDSTMEVEDEKLQSVLKKENNINKKGTPVNLEYLFMYFLKQKNKNPLVY